MRKSESQLAPGWYVYGANQDPQSPYQVAVVMPSIGRASVGRAVQSVFNQIGVGRIQLLIGLDAIAGDCDELFDVLKRIPPNVTVNLFYPGYSTSVRHGGVHLARDGGSLRASLSLLANARYVAYLDDDNWWSNNHLSSLLEAIEGKAWAFSLRYFVHPESQVPICPDTWESIGPGRGFFEKKFGGWVDPNSLMLDKLEYTPILGLWCIPLSGDSDGMSADRRIFDAIKRASSPGETGRLTTFYVMQPADGLHKLRLKIMRDLYDKAGSANSLS
ncbi:glycosyltransferase family A protein [Undibacterium fentianense]|uniref:Glycosyltransferase n=1 Tax=Undibacterium fentianense TaxID=2828728 RepID=A0A941IIB4_9BURK|nr:glycosyltransferase family A protein [Undibacterium fentianense]MBR7801780.1 hypothetical protein [Undibacterium fentianense]